MVSDVQRRESPLRCCRLPLPVVTGALSESAPSGATIVLVFLFFFLSAINILDVSSCPQAGTFSANLPQAVCHDQFYSCRILILFFANRQKCFIHLHLSICSFSHSLDFNFMVLFLAAHLLLLCFLHFFVSWHIPPGSDPFGSICTHIPIVFCCFPLHQLTGCQTHTTSSPVMMYTHLKWRNRKNL